METQFIEIRGIKIAFVESNPQSQDVLFFIHGNSGSKSTWLKQLQDERFANYRLIAIDLPAHGDSAGLLLSQHYNCIFFAEILSLFIKQKLKDAAFILIGFSLGANIVAELMAFSIFPKGIVLVGSTVIGGNFNVDVALKAGPGSNIFFEEFVPDEELAGLISDLLSLEYEDDKQVAIDDFKRVKHPFRSSLLHNSLHEGKISNEIELLQKQTSSLLIIFGKEEKIANPDYLNDAPFQLWNGSVHQVENCGHTVHVSQPAIFNDLLLQYSNEMLK